jgi:hypothetical protein
VTCIRTRIACVLIALAIAAPARAADPPPVGADTAGRAAATSGQSKRTKAESQAPADKATDKPEDKPAGDASEKPAGDGVTAAPAEAPQQDDPDLDVNLAQPDFMLSALQTTLRLPRNRLAFRLTHRFNQPLDESGFDDLWGMDSGAIIGFEFRYGVIPGGQVGFYRTSDRTIEFFSQYDVFKQGGGMPLGIAAFGGVEGTDNFTDKYSPTIGAIVSREFGTRAAAYAHPFWVNNTNPDPSELVDHNSTMMLGFGVRVRVFSATYLVAEAAPRLSGYAPGTTHVSFGIEQRAGGHLFQLTFANNQGTTPANVARGGPSGNNWYLGFNLARKFF